jgi:3-oxoacyl-[acyl-carrier protein] reductase
MKFEEQTALITGATRGIGRAILIELGQKGAYVIGTATSEKGVESIEATIKEHGLKGEASVLDVSSTDSVDQFVAQLAEAKQTPTILINNAGITRDNLLMRMKADEWDDVIQTNLNSIYRMSKAFMRGMMKARYGRIINIGSVVGLTGNPGQTNYCASKGGVQSFSKALAQEIGSRGVTVNVIAPGFIDTDMTDALEEDQQKALLTRIPTGRIGKVEDIASAVSFLASEQAGYITGETLNVNGGMYMP